jgi:CBS domain containing-hemolysin-like protein
MSTPVALLISLLLLILNGFFVSAEFALVASKRHRLEQAAATGSRAARAAIAGRRDRLAARPVGGDGAEVLGDQRS